MNKVSSGREAQYIKMDTTKKTAKRKGRPPKKDYDEARVMTQLLECVDLCYDSTGEIKATALELGMSTLKVKKLLITSGKLVYDETKQIQRLMAYGKKMSEIQNELGLKKSSINAYLPYSKIPYKESEISANAERCDLYRRRKEAVEKIKGEDSLYECIILFSGYKFQTDSGVDFVYRMKKNDDEKYSDELIIEKTKHRIKLADLLTIYEKVLKKEKVTSPDDFGEVSDADYIYAIFRRLKLVPVCSSEMDINKLNEIAHSHSIVVIKDSFQKFPNRFLVYEDKRWNCEFFPNYKENHNNEEFIKSHISNELKIELSNIKLKYVSQKIHEKYSESAKENKIYSHKFYLAEITDFPDFMRQETFECDGKVYHWRSMPELEDNREVQKKNMDILNFVKELF